MKDDSMFGSFVKKLRDDRRLEILVYSLLMLTAAIIFVSTGGISCKGNGAGMQSKSGAQASSDDRIELESRLESILSSIEGAGKVKVMAVSGGSGAEGACVLGVIVVAEGADDIGVRVKLQSAVTTVLGIDPCRVGIFTME